MDDQCAILSEGTLARARAYLWRSVVGMTCCLRYTGMSEGRDCFTRAIQRGQGEGRPKQRSRCRLLTTTARIAPTIRCGFAGRRAAADPHPDLPLGLGPTGPAHQLRTLPTL